MLVVSAARIDHIKTRETRRRAGLPLLRTIGLDCKAAMTPLDPQDYRSYLLRLWKAREDHETWRASLERVDTGERRGFASLGALYEFLQAVTGDVPGTQERRVDGEAANEGS